MQAPSQSLRASSASVHGDLPQVFGRYLLLQRLSSGGMGEIFLAKHGLSGFEKICVIKKVLPHLSEDEHFISRFVDEAQVAIQLQHANIAQVFEVGRVDEQYFLSLEFVEGCDLRRALLRLGEQNRRFPVEMALLISRDIASGLAYAHRRKDAAGKSLGLVHCDISPPNVMLSFEGEVKIIDFGIAKSALRGTATDPKMGFGKIGYMAPEQLVRGGRIDHRTDIYATGAILFEVLTGQRLYEVDSSDYRDLARKIVRGKHALPSQVDRALQPFDELVARALHTDVERRYQSAAELRDALQTALVGIHPTLSNDYVGAFVRQLFAGEMAELRRLAAHAQGADLAPWQDQLSHFSNATVSFALAPGAPMPHAQLPGSLAAESGHDTIRSTVPGQSRLALWCMAAVALLVGSALMVTALTGSPHKAQPAAAVPGQSGAAGAQNGPQQGSQKGLDNGPDQAQPSSAVALAPAAGAAGARNEPEAASEAEPEIELADSEAEPTAPARTKPARRTAKSSRRSQSRARQEKLERTAKDEDSRAAVSAKFSAIHQEYRKFKQSYGGRLEQEWAELGDAVVYAGEDPVKLRRLSRSLDRFRAQMREIRASGTP